MKGRIFLSFSPNFVVIEINMYQKIVNESRNARSRQEKVASLYSFLPVVSHLKFKKLQFKIFSLQEQNFMIVLFETA